MDRRLAQLTQQLRCDVVHAGASAARATAAHAVDDAAVQVMMVQVVPAPRAAAAASAGVVSLAVGGYIICCNILTHR